MHCLKRFMLAGLFIVPVLFVQSALAVLELEFIPESSHYQGRSYKTGLGGDRVRVDFAVYVTRQDGSSEFTDEGFAAPGDGRFTYVYQVFNDFDDDDFSIDIFRIFGLEQEAFSENDQISSEDDQEDGIATDLQYFSPSKTDGIWEFEEGALTKGEHSWFLTISSDSDYIVGDWSLQSDPDEEVPIPVPEPASMILFGVGSFLLMARRKGSVGMSR